MHANPKPLAHSPISITPSGAYKTLDIYFPTFLIFLQFREKVAEKKALKYPHAFPFPFPSFFYFFIFFWDSLYI